MSFSEGNEKENNHFFFVGLLSGTLLAFVWCPFLLRCEVTVSSKRLKNSQSRCRVLLALGCMVCIFKMSSPDHSIAQAPQFFLCIERRRLLSCQQQPVYFLLIWQDGLSISIHSVTLSTLTSFYNVSCSIPWAFSFPMN